jgi:hypothetical protein
MKVFSSSALQLFSFSALQLFGAQLGTRRDL